MKKLKKILAWFILSQILVFIIWIVNGSMFTPDPLMAWIACEIVVAFFGGIILIANWCLKTLNQ